MAAARRSPAQTPPGSTVPSRPSGSSAGRAKTGHPSGRSGLAGLVCGPLHTLFPLPRRGGLPAPGKVSETMGGHTLATGGPGQPLRRPPGHRLRKHALKPPQQIAPSAARACTLTPEPRGARAPRLLRGHLRVCFRKVGPLPTRREAALLRHPHRSSPPKFLPLRKVNSPREESQTHATRSVQAGRPHRPAEAHSPASLPGSCGQGPGRSPRAPQAALQPPASPASASAVIAGGGD